MNFCQISNWLIGLVLPGGRTNVSKRLSSPGWSSSQVEELVRWAETFEGGAFCSDGQWKTDELTFIPIYLHFIYFCMLDDKNSDRLVRHIFVSPPRRRRSSPCCCPRSSQLMCRSVCVCVCVSRGSSFTVKMGRKYSSRQNTKCPVC